MVWVLWVLGVLMVWAWALVVDLLVGRSEGDSEGSLRLLGLLRGLVRALSLLWEVLLESLLSLWLLRSLLPLLLLTLSLGALVGSLVGRPKHLVLATRLEDLRLKRMQTMLPRPLVGSVVALILCAGLAVPRFRTGCKLLLLR